MLASRRLWPGEPGNTWEGVAAGFSKRYGLKRLVFAEWHQTLLAAKQRESNLKHWPRAWKVRLILKENLTWDDLYERLL
jgi:putative endonuclease